MFFSDGEINTRNISNKEIKSIKIGKIFTNISKGHTNI